ncbi:phage tail protein [Burkholderia stagnalis]|uniref:Phage tail protein n=1 Tax=Burkholderia stagnalis TaxID=1503054 RepID=A0ABX9YE49_9BURK|nr:phage tail protein [Burkholderia stagnalis]RQQ47585.1 phage tail protein [Burkholderia stagnalis]RQQ59324.1 phage tail protein [Burkholderia stagnalis]RQQ59802.1 phage tail protein [Burkholderia stagnalis]RQQ74145.1 phage tail protein [Burkholderia stagnalis]RQQ79877.1 phage tail protein [Burkholderia stagnalis]
MALDAKTMGNTYPIPTYRFVVSVGKDQMCFSTVSGLDQSVQLVTYKDGCGNLYQMPGQVEPVTITLKRGMMPKQSQLLDWFNSISFNRVDKRDLSISLTNEAGSELLVTWSVSNAFPTKCTGPSLDATSNEVAFEELSLAADRVSVVFH